MVKLVELQTYPTWMKVNMSDTLDTGMMETGGAVTK